MQISFKNAELVDTMISEFVVVA